MGKIQLNSKGSQSLATPRPGVGNSPESALEKIILQGDLSSLSDVQRVVYNNKLCESLGLNPLTKPIDYIKQGGRLSAFVNSQGLAQLRKIYGVSTQIRDRQYLEPDLYQVVAIASTRDGRSEESSAVIALADKYGKKLAGQDRANKIMAAETKAKRRATLGLIGLPLLGNDTEGTVQKASAYDPPQDVIPAEYRHNPKNIKEIAVAAESVQSPQELIGKAYKELKWTEAAWKLMIKEWFRVEKTAEITNTEGLIAVARNKQERDKYVQQATEPQQVVAEIVDDKPVELVEPIKPIWQMSEVKIAELRESWTKNTWTKPALEECLLSYFDIQGLGAIQGLDEEQFESLRTMLVNHQVKKEFGLVL